MGDEVARARRALGVGNVDEALVLLWKALEPARLADDRARLREIAQVAAAIPNNEGADLIAATGAEPSASEWIRPPAGTPRRGRPITPLLWVFVGLLLLIMVGSQVYRSVPHISFPDVKVHDTAAAPSHVTLQADGLYLVPLARYPEEELTDVATGIINAAGAVETMPPFPLGPTTYDPSSGQFVAGEILRRLSEAYGVADGVDALVVGVTSLAVRDDAGPVTAARSEDGVFVVVSTSALSDDREARRNRLGRIILDEIEQAGLNAT
jgi:hypothetical protein